MDKQLKSGAKKDILKESIKDTSTKILAPICLLAVLSGLIFLLAKGLKYIIGPTFDGNWTPSIIAGIVIFLLFFFGDIIVGYNHRITKYKKSKYEEPKLKSEIGLK